MVFNARANVWDLCPMLSSLAGDNDGELDKLDELDEADDALGEGMDRLLLEPDTPAQLPGEDTSDLGFLYRRYGFLTVKPTSIPANMLELSKAAARRITGLKSDGLDDGLGYAGSFITSVLGGQLPDGHCDLTPTSPDNEQFSSSQWGVIDRVSRVTVPDNLGGALFACTPRDNRNKILIHNPLTVIEMGRMKVQTYRTSIVDYLLRNGSQFTILSEEPQDMDTSNVHILTFPVRPMSWVADVQDYQIYMSRLKTFLTQRPHVAAAALTRGGIAWQLTQEVLGIDIDLVLNGPVFKGQALAVDIADFPQWCHDVDEGDWFFLVGGYDILTGSLVLCYALILANAQTGKGSQTRDISWWPKVSAWKGCGLDVGCWTPLCEHWFQRRLENIVSGKARPLGSVTWVKNLRYEKETKKFFTQFNRLGDQFLANNYPNLSAQ